MKVLIDPVSTNDPEYCSAHYKMQLLTKHLLESRPDMFVYYVLPGGDSWEINQDWLIKSDRVEYITIPQDRDRMKEYNRLSYERETLYAYNGSHWDWDALITGRSLGISMGRSWMTRNNGWANRLVLIEDEFPIMSFKKRVTLPHPEAADLFAIANYMAADKTFMFSVASKGMLIREARHYLSPSRVMELSDKITTALPVQFNNIKAKSDEYVKRVATREKPFTVAYTQRLSGKVNRQDDALEAFEKEWVRFGGKDATRLLVTTNSPVVKDYEHLPYATFMRANREKFWYLMEHEADVCVSVSRDEDYPLSLLEPLAFGVPLIMYKADYVADTYGPDYPFVVSGLTQLFGMIQAFKADYEGMYAKFRVWFDTWFVPEMTRRNQLWFVPMVSDALFDHDLKLKTINQSKTEGDVGQLLHAMGMANGGKLNIGEGLKELSKTGALNHLGQLYGKDRDSIGYSFGTEWNLYRRVLIYAYGWKDSGLGRGMLEKT